MSIATHFLFLVCVALATYTQSATGFAFGLILLGLVGVFELVPVADAANAANVLVLVNAWVYFRHRKPKPLWSVLRPTLIASLIGVMCGVALLGWLSENAVEWLRLLLGVAILACALLLLLQVRPLAQSSSPASFRLYGSLSGLLSGLFSSGGPPIVFHMYRQPLDQAVIRECLLFLFAANAAVRLGIVAFLGNFSSQTLLLSLEAVPVVFAVTWWHAKKPPRIALQHVRQAVCGLLMVAGLALIWSAGKSFAT
jgi:uncharacterized membrane protein YfcA